MARQFTLEKCENRDQIQKQFERCIDGISAAGVHLQIIANSYGPGYEKYRLLIEGVSEALFTVLELVEDAKGRC